MTKLIARGALLIILGFAPALLEASPYEVLEEKVKGSKWRSDRLERSEEVWQKMLPSKQYEVLREKGTEMPFTSSLLAQKEEGTFTCAACGLELFSTKDKFDSGTGWPSFTKPTGTDTLYYKVDETLSEKRVEVVCARCGSHLGHVFPKGQSTEEFRYCINGTSLQFKSAKEEVAPK
jgi:peptide-methionine (R)-S-oxide reductase